MASSAAIRQKEVREFSAALIPGKDDTSKSPNFPVCGIRIRKATTAGIAKDTISTILL
jgi:hypothetical protein